jgi:hypothetical protein
LSGYEEKKLVMIIYFTHIFNESQLIWTPRGGTFGCTGTVLAKLLAFSGVWVTLKGTFLLYRRIIDDEPAFAGNRMARDERFL